MSEMFFGNVESKTVSSMNLAACVLKPCWSICLERGSDGCIQGRLSSGRLEKRACGLSEGLAGALPEVKYKV